MNPCLNGFWIRPCNSIYGFYTIHIHEYTSQIASRFFVRCTLFLQEILNGFELNTINFQRTPALLKRQFTWDYLNFFLFAEQLYLRKAMNKTFSWNLNLTLVWWKKNYGDFKKVQKILLKMINVQLAFEHSWTQLMFTCFNSTIETPESATKTRNRRLWKDFTQASGAAIMDFEQVDNIRDIGAVFISITFTELATLRKKSPYSELFWSAFFPHFPAFELNTERYSLSLRIQSECEKIRKKCGPDQLRIRTLFTQ